MSVVFRLVLIAFFLLGQCVLCCFRERPYFAVCPTENSGILLNEHLFQSQNIVVPPGHRKIAVPSRANLACSTLRADEEDSVVGSTAQET